MKKEQIYNNVEVKLGLKDRLKIAFGSGLKVKTTIVIDGDVTIIESDSSIVVDDFKFKIFRKQKFECKTNSVFGLSDDLKLWADYYFSCGNNKTDQILSQIQVQADFEDFVNYRWTGRHFMKQLELYFEKHQHERYILNPAEMRNDSGRILTREFGNTTLGIYVKSINKINE